jgi:hypothetical protein
MEIEGAAVRVGPSSKIISLGTIGQDELRKAGGGGDKKVDRSFHME